MNKTDLLAYLLQLGDDALITGHRNSEWTGHGPILEQDIALTNIALDQIGQARNLYQYTAVIAGDGSNEDSYAYLRDAPDFRNCLLAEQPNGDWGSTILRNFFFSSFRFDLFNALSNSTDQQLAAIAAKSLKETTYHLRWSSEWVIRLGDGTDESHSRMCAALESLWPFTAELFSETDFEQSAAAAGVGVLPGKIQPAFDDRVNAVLAEAQLTVPGNRSMGPAGKLGRHSQHLDLLLNDLQHLQRTYPGATW